MTLTNKSELMKVGLIGGALAVGLVGLVALRGPPQPIIDPRVEEACFKEVRNRAPHGSRTIMTFSYREEGKRLGVAQGSLEAKYNKDQWTQVGWTCRINPTNREIARVELSATSGGQRIRAAATRFK